VCSVDVPISRAALAAGSPWARELSRGARAREAGQSGAESELASTVCLSCISPSFHPSDPHHRDLQCEQSARAT